MVTEPEGKERPDDRTRDEAEDVVGRVGVHDPGERDSHEQRCLRVGEKCHARRQGGFGAAEVPQADERCREHDEPGGLGPACLELDCLFGPPRGDHVRRG
jgi:hypothetical protein